jgi:hypothetical protein
MSRSEAPKLDQSRSSLDRAPVELPGELLQQAIASNQQLVVALGRLCDLCSTLLEGDMVADGEAVVAEVRSALNSSATVNGMLDQGTHAFWELLRKSSVQGLLSLGKHILVVGHDRPLRDTQITLLTDHGYRVDNVDTDDDAMTLLETEQFDLILIGQESVMARKGVDQRLREKYPNLLTIKIEAGASASPYASRIIDPAPRHVIEAIYEMLGDGLDLVPVRLVACGSTPERD